MMRKREKGKLTGKAIRCIASAVCVLGVLAVCLGIAGYQDKVQAGDDQIVTRGVVKSLGQIPQTKKDMYDNKKNTYKKGTKENPFLVLEILPYEEYAEFGYQISGCEPVDLHKICGHMSALTSLNTATIEQQNPAYFFPEEPEADESLYDPIDNGTNPGIKKYWVNNQSFEGYYERVEDGEGYFKQNEDGSIDKANHGNIIWHTMCTSEKKYASNVTFTEADEPKKKLEKIGDRIYTKRINTEDDPVLITYTYYYYKNNDNFLKQTLKLNDSEADDYSIIVKTITPKELNESPQWADYADLYVVSHTSHVQNLPDTWRKYNRFGKTGTQGTLINSFENTEDDKDRDISWEVARKMYDKITSDQNYAAIVIDANTYTPKENDSNSPLTKSVQKGYDVAVYDWNLNETEIRFNSVGHLISNNNVYKLAVMLFSMEPSLFRSLYIDSGLIDDNGNFLLRDKENPESYWSMYTFLLVGPDGENVNSIEDYWTKSDKWENYETEGNITTSRCIVNRRVYSFNSDTNTTQKYLDNAIDTSSENYRYQDFKDFIKKENAGSDGKVSTSDAIRYILGYTGDGEDVIKRDLNILDIEPSFDSKLNVQTGCGYTLKESYIRMMIPKLRGKINIRHMTTAEFIGLAEDLNSTYDMIFMGLDCGGFTLHDENASDITYIYYSKDAGKDKHYEATETNDEIKNLSGLPHWYDKNMDGKIYFHTGDLMTKGYDRTPTYKNNGIEWNDRKRKVDFLGVTETDDKQEEWMRFSGNDITTIKKTELNNYLDAGYPIVAVPYLYNTDTTRIDQYSNICSFIKENKNSEQKNSTLYATSDIGNIESVLKRAKAEISYSKLPNIYNGQSDDTGKITNPNYLERDSSDFHLLPFTFTVTDEDNHQYGSKLYLDQNRDGKFDEDEIFAEGDLFYAKDGEQYLIYRLSRLYFGLIQWKLEIYREDNPQVHFVQTGCSVAENVSGKREKINVLQIMPKDGDYDGKLDLSTSDIFCKYYNQLKDYEITVTTMTVDQYESYFTWNSKFQYDYAKGIVEEGSEKNPKNIADGQKNLLKNYHMIIVGFGDSYGGKNISNDYGAVDFLKYYVDSGKSILFTHDLTSMYNTETDVFGYSANTLLRDYLGMNRYEAVNTTMSSEDQDKLRRYQKNNKYDTVTDVSGKDLEQTHGFTYYAMKRLGWTWNASCGKGKMPYQYLITNTDGNPICSDTNSKNIPSYTTTYEEKSGFNNNNDITTKATQVNEGQITQYPYKIGSTLSIADTHGQWFQLDMEDPEVTVWYALSDDGLHAQWPSAYCSDKEKKATELDKNGHDRGDRWFMDQNKPGTAATYGVSPNDVSNNYYIYSKGNVFYSGVGHSEVTGDQEAQLFINTMIAAYRAQYASPMVEVMNSEADLTSKEDANPLTYSINIAQEYEAETTEIKEIEFCPVDMNINSPQLDCSIWYYDKDDKVIEYVPEIYYYSSKGEKITLQPTKTDEKGNKYFVNLKNRKKYYFEYPESYLKDGKTKIKFQITNNLKDSNKNDVPPGETLLDLSVRALFLLD